MSVLGIDHIGVAVNDLVAAKSQYKLLGYNCVGDEIEYPSRNIRIQYMQIENLKIELITPLVFEQNSPVDRYIRSSRCYTMYHTCYSVSNIYDQINELKNKRYSLIETPERSSAMDNRIACYLFSRDMGLVELVQDEEKNRISDHV